MAKKKKAKKAQSTSIVTVDEHTLDRLYLVIDSRKGADPETSYTARLFSRGRQQIAKRGRAASGKFKPIKAENR